jgi:hypothetical protein
LIHRPSSYFLTAHFSLALVLQLDGIEAISDQFGKWQEIIQGHVPA